MKLKSFRETNVLRTVIVGTLVIAIFIGIMVHYYNMVYDAKKNNLIKDGRMAARESADQFDRYLSTNEDLIKFAAYTLNEMILEKRSDEEIQDYLVSQSTAVRNAVLENSTGLYGYINGRFFSGTNWEPPEGYDATARPWYTKAMSSPGQLTILEPYLDVQSGNTMLALGKTLCDRVSVISVDVSLDQMQKLTEDAVKTGGSDIEMILTDEGVVVTHSDIGEVGKNYSESDGTLGAKIFSLSGSEDEGYFEFDHEGKHYIGYDAKFEGNWHCISVHDATVVFASLRNFLIRTIFVAVVIVITLGIMLTISGKRAVTARKAVAANEAKTEFLSNMSHEIRTPINAVLGMNEMILRESGEENIRGYSEKIRTAGQELLKLVNELLDFSKSESGQPGAKERYGFIAPSADVLAVDDNSMNLEVLKSLLKRTGVRIDTAQSGDEAIGLMKEKKYDIIFLDHMMPEKDGIETLHELRSIKDQPNLETPVICLTANAIKGAKENYLSEGFDDYLSKPVDSQKLEDILRKYLPEDKIVRNRHTEDEEAPKEAIPEELLELRETAAIDPEEGIKNSGSLEAYLPLLKIFYDSMGEKQKEIGDFHDKNDIKNYAIRVHALKSSARIVGASAFGMKAEALEKAAKSGDTDYIRRNHAAFLKEYESFREPLSRIFDKEEDDAGKPEADPAFMDESLGLLRLAADDMDCDRVQEILEETERFRIPEDRSELFKHLKEASANYDYMRIVELIDHADKG